MIVELEIKWRRKKLQHYRLNTNLEYFLGKSTILCKDHIGGCKEDLVKLGRIITPGVYLMRSMYDERLGVSQTKNWVYS
jgi:hypothetical protein